MKYINNVELMLEKVRKTRLLGSNIEVYKDSKIEFKHMQALCLYPCQTYVLEKQVDKMHELNDLFIERGYPEYPFLQGFVELDGFTFTPPIVEFSEDEGCYLVNDGMHRVYAAMEMGYYYINCIVIHDPSYPYYAYPLNGVWDDVSLLTDEIPKNFIKKYHRVEDYKKLYRDFNTAFDQHVGAPRGRGKQ